MGLATPNVIGLPGSTHATPSYTRFGEPYGVSISASPSIARNFSADDYIHRVQPLYGGPPTERIIPLWRPEGQKAMNEGYNAAFNEWLGQRPGGRWGSGVPDYNSVLAGYLGHSEAGTDLLANRMDDFLRGVGKTGTADFNTLYSKALQDKGYRGILYSPQRYGEYEMLMLDPSYVRPLDYRKLEDYVPAKKLDKMWPTWQGGGHGVPMTPGAVQGYKGAGPEFATGATRLTDAFNQIPWTDRINDANKQRILELIDAKYREMVGNQLFGR